MVVLVLGGSSSGKSEYAEKLLQNVTEKKYYIATMEPFGAEGIERVQKHRTQRAGKGFETIEKFVNLQELHFSADSSILLECMGNLVANEIFYRSDDANTVEKITIAVQSMCKMVNNVVIVSNDVFSDGRNISCEMTHYLQVLGKINRNIAEFADNVFELSSGIPTVIKGELL